MLRHSKAGDIGAPCAGWQALPRTSRGAIVILSTLLSHSRRRCSTTALKAKASTAKAIVAKFRLGRMRTAHQYYFKAIIAILIAHITKMIAPMAIAIFIVSSSSLVIASPMLRSKRTRSPATSEFLATGEAWRARLKLAPPGALFFLSFAHAGAQIFV
jgi:hypothetical protein